MYDSDSWIADDDRWFTSKDLKLPEKQEDNVPQSPKPPEQENPEPEKPRMGLWDHD